MKKKNVSSCSDSCLNKLIQITMNKNEVEKNKIEPGSIKIKSVKDDMAQIKAAVFKCEPRH